MKETQKRVVNRRKRLNLSVKRDFQFWLLIRIGGVVIVSSLVAVLILYFYSSQEISSSFYSAHIKIRRVSDLLWLVMATGAIVSLLSGLLLALFLPQKLAGPIYRVQKIVNIVKDGDLTEKVVLRSGDPFMDLGDSVNDAIAGLRGRIEQVKQVHGELEQLIATLESQEAGTLSARQKELLAFFRT